MTDNNLKVVDLQRTSSINVAVAGNCLAANTQVTANVRVQGMTRRQKSAVDCQLPQLRNLRAIYYSGSGVTISYNVQDAQNMTCELVIGDQKITAKCDGDSHVLSGVAVNGFSLGTTTVSMLVNQAQLGTAKIESSRIAAITSTALITPTISFTPNSATVSASISLDFSENMQLMFGTVGAYNPESSLWPTPRKFTVVFRSYVPGGTMTFQKSAFLSVSGKRMANDLAYTFPPSTTATATTGRLPASGITADQCYQAGSNVLVACNSAGALALNPQQDGHRAAVNAMSYSIVSNYPITSCVKDNITGLIWEGKEASGQRAGGNLYTNFDSSYGSTAQIVAATNTIGFVNYVNSISLCGFIDWRLPSVDELQTIVDYSLSNSGSTLNTTWFPNVIEHSWSSSNFLGSIGGAWGVSFSIGSADGYGSRESRFGVRLVRASP